MFLQPGSCTSVFRMLHTMEVIEVNEKERERDKQQGKGREGDGETGRHCGQDDGEE